MVKHGSGHLRYSIMNIAMTILRYSPTFYDYYLKKRSEGKCHRVALSHVCKKLIRVIYCLEKTTLILIRLYLINLFKLLNDYFKNLKNYGFEVLWHGIISNL